MRQLTAAVFGVLTQFNGLNGYLIRGEDGFTLVDTGLKGFDRYVRRALRQLGSTLTDLKRIIITHAHPDHVGALPSLQQQVNATTYAHRLDAPVIRGDWPIAYPKPEELGALSRFVLGRMQSNSLVPARIDVELSDGQTLNEVAAGACVLHLPGHSHGQIGLYLPEEKTLIGGDVLMHLPWGLTLPLRPASPDWAAVKTSIRKVAELPLENLLLGHGAPILGGAQARLEAFVRQL
jgi:glyoxylase-like metal-dependent hydrolase (beta-lactamase superfamily II)